MGPVSIKRRPASLLLIKCKEWRAPANGSDAEQQRASDDPKAVRDRLQIKPGDRFKFFFHPDGVIILPRIPTSRLKGMIPKPAKPASLQEIDRAIEDGATQRFRRKK
jgi:AbrB family looped-hinge helix DNA binding protein